MELLLLDSNWYVRVSYCQDYSKGLGHPSLPMPLTKVSLDPPLRSIYDESTELSRKHRSGLHEMQQVS